MNAQSTQGRLPIWSSSVAKTLHLGMARIELLTGRFVYVLCMHIHNYDSIVHCYMFIHTVLNMCMHYILFQLQVFHSCTNSTGKKNSITQSYISHVNEYQYTNLPDQKLSVRL